MANTSITNSNVVSANQVIDDQIDLSILAEEGQSVGFEGISNSHEMGIFPSEDIVADAHLSRENARELLKELQKSAIAASNLTSNNGRRHPRATLLTKGFRYLATVILQNLQDWSNASWIDFEVHQHPYIGVFSFYERMLILNEGGIGILSSKTNNYGHIYPAKEDPTTKDGWVLRVKGQRIDVSAKTITYLLATVVPGSVQNIAWGRLGVMTSSTNYDGRTMVVKPRQGQDLIQIVDIKTGEVWSFPELRISCDYWVYAVMLESVAVAYLPKREARTAAQKRQQALEQKYSDLNVKYFGDAKHICRNASEYEFLHFIIALENSSNKEKLFQSNLLKNYSSDDLKSYATFSAKRESLINAAIAKKNSKVQVKTVEASEESLNAAISELDIFGGHDEASF